MGTPSQWWVDPDIGADSGLGTEGSPFGDLQYGLNEVGTAPGRDAANGDDFNVIAGTDEEPVATIDLTAYDNPAGDAPLIIRGSNGIGGIDGGAGGFSIFAGAADYVHFIDMHLHNTAGAVVLVTGTDSSVINCEFDASTARGLTLGFYGKCINSHFHDITGRDLVPTAYCQVLGNFFNTSSLSAIHLTSAHNTVMHNVIVTNALATIGINVNFYNQALIANSILSTVASTASAVRFDGTTHRDCLILSNLIEGFSGVGGAGIDFGNLLRHISMYANNSFHGNANDVINDCDKNYEADNDLAMATSPFAKDGALTFANRFKYFAPRHVGNVRGGAFPNGCRIDRGAVQHGSMLVHPGTSGGARG